MMLEILAAAAVGSAPPPKAPPGPSTPVAPVTVESPPPDFKDQPVAATVDVPVDDTANGLWASAWPEGAYQAGISGYVWLSCGIDRFGLAEWCKVASETPAGRGFGAAALALRPTFKLKPPIGPDGQAVDKVMLVALRFRAPNLRIDFGKNREGGPVGERANPTGSNPAYEFSDITMFGDPAVRRSISMLNNPVWASTIGYDDLMKAYPAKAAGAAGYAVAHCEVSRNGGLSGCEPTAEDPQGKGFGRAAVKLASRFKVSPEWARAPGHADLWVDVPIRFSAPGAAENRTVTAPYWVAGFDPNQVLKVYPPEAAAKGVTTGRGMAKCVVAEDGALTDCAAEQGDPDGLGFSEAAVRLASTMRMNPWTTDGAPVDGAVVRVGVTLNLASP